MPDWPWRLVVWFIRFYERVHETRSVQKLFMPTGWRWSGRCGPAVLRDLLDDDGSTGHIQCQVINMHGEDESASGEDQLKANDNRRVVWMLGCWYTIGPQHAVISHACQSELRVR